MASKKKKSARKSAQLSDDERAAKRAARLARKAAGGGRKRAGKGTIVYFMGQLIQAGYAGEEIPESAGDQRRAAQLLRQFAERLAAQTRKYGDEDVIPGGDAGGGDDEEEGGEE